MTTLGSKSAVLLLGKSVQMSKIGVKQIPCVKVRCQENEYDTFLKMYFCKSTDYWALDKTGNAQIGDTVLIQPVDLSNRLASTVTHEVNRVVMQFGSKFDPITKMRIIDQDFMDRHELRSKMINDRTGFNKRQ